MYRLQAASRYLCGAKGDIVARRSATNAYTPYLILFTGFLPFLTDSCYDESPKQIVSSDLRHSTTLIKDTLMSESAPTPVPPSEPASPTPAAPDPAARKEELRLAMKAFRKRLKLTKLDDESRIGP